MKVLFARISLGFGLLSMVLGAGANSENYSPTLGNGYPMSVLWGDTHLHSSYSTDAFMMGAQNMTPLDAYRFARGESVTASNGMTAKLNRPLDFLVVSDHAEYLGLLPALTDGESDALAIKSGRRWHNMLKAEGEQAWNALMEIFRTFTANADPVSGTKKVQVSKWSEVISYADEANNPGVFSALIGFEWSPAPDGDNLHRVVIFRDGAEKAGQVSPFSAFDSKNPEDLWRYLEDYESKTGGGVIAIPHNGNVSNGRMYTETNFSGDPIDQEYAERRSRWEPLMEVTQIKGDGETHPFLSPDDEFANYGTWDSGNLLGTKAKKPWMLQYEYARSALRLGLQIAGKVDANPYRYGMIGSTDAHAGMSAVEEDNFWGKFALHEPSPRRTIGPLVENEAAANSKLAIEKWEQVSSGYAAVWATANTREAIFDAMKRREVYATTGPRMTVRFFGGWDFEAGDVARPDYALIGYDKGVPMGGELPPGFKRTTAPRFMITALKDPQGANLDRVQVIKGWLDADGKTHEQVYDVAWSGDRQPATDGRLPAVGSTVDLKNATWQNTIGAVQLSTVWTDPDFDPDQRAFYYVRVLEIPTPRWVVYDQVRLGAELPADAERVHQERAYTSPIWYEPSR